MELRELSDSALLSQTESLVGQRSRSSVVLIEHIAEIDRRQAHRGAGFPSLHVYCVRRLGMSDEVAWKRIRNARVSRKFPLVLEYLRENRIHLRGITLLAPVLTADNVRELLDAASGKTRSQIERMLVARFPKPAPKSEVRKLPSVRRPEPPPLVEDPRGDAARSPQPLVFEPPPTPARRSMTEPISANEYKLQILADEETYHYVQELRGMMRHRIPDGDLAKICKLALRNLHQQVMKERYGVGRKRQNGKKKKPPGDKGSRHIPDAVKAEVFERDGGRCTFVAEDGTRCDATEFLEFDHHPVPWAKGGESVVNNLRLRCRSHNQLSAEKTYGRAKMARERSGG